MPDNVHELHGTTPHAARAHDGVGTKQVTLGAVAPNPPAHLCREAKAEWKRVVPELNGAGLLALIDRSTLSNYCTAWAVFVRCSKELEALPAVAIEGQQTRVKAPEFMAWRDASATLNSLAKEVFATPVARLRARRPEARPDEQGADIFD